jgi:phage terminase small subunit
MLTAKQEKFVQGIIEGKSQAEAYRSAYNCEKMSDNAIYREASLLMDAPKIAQRLKELREQMMKPTIMSAQERLEYLTRVIKGEETEEVFCWEDGERVSVNNPATIKTRLQAIDLMNKMQGEYVQKVVADVDTSYTINIELSDD